MPIRNEAHFIRRSLEAVLRQDYSSDAMEVLIADGMSTDATRDVIEATIAQYPDISVTVLDNPQRIVPTGFNIALQRARGDVVVRVDGHTIIESDYVRQCVDTLYRIGADNVGGCMNAVGTGRWGQVIALATSSPFGVGGAQFHFSESEMWVDTVYMGAWPREVFDRIGPFDEEMVRNQDDEFNYRLRAHGGKILLNPQIKSHYYNRNSLNRLVRQYYQYGFYKIRVMQKHPRQMRPRQFVPFFFVMFLVSGMILIPLSVSSRWLWLSVLLAYLLVNLAASVQISQRKGHHVLPLLPIVFATLHISYGLGFLLGLIAFWNRWRS